MNQQSLEKIYLRCKDDVKIWEQQKKKTLLSSLMIVVGFTLPVIFIFTLEAFESLIPFDYYDVLLLILSFLAGFSLGFYYGNAFALVVISYQFMQSYLNVLKAIDFLADETPTINPSRHKNISFRWMRYAHLNEDELLARYRKDLGHIQRYQYVAYIACVAVCIAMLKFGPNQKSGFGFWFIDQRMCDFGFYLGLIPSYLLAQYMYLIFVKRLTIPAIEKLRKEKLLIKLYETQKPKVTL